MFAVVLNSGGSSFWSRGGLLVIAVAVVDLVVEVVLVSGHRRWSSLSLVVLVV